MTSIETHDYKNTMRQFFGNFRRNLRPKHLLADFYAESLDAVTNELLAALGINTIIWDVDGTLMGYHGTEVDASAKEAFKKLMTGHGLPKPLNHILLSNSGEQRYRQLSYIFPNIPNFRMYQRIDDPEDVLYRILYLNSDTFCKQVHVNCLHFQFNYVISKPEEIVRRKRELPCRLKDYTVIKKPDARLIEGALLWYHRDKSQAVMIGDRHSTDISGAKQAGIRAIRVAPLYPETDPLLPRIGRVFEDMLVGLYKMRYGHADLVK